MERSVSLGGPGKLIKTGPDKPALLNERWMSCLLSKLVSWLQSVGWLSYSVGVNGMTLNPGLKNKLRKWLM